MIKQYLKSKLCPDSVNRMQIDVDLSDTKAVRRAISTLVAAIPDEERVFSRDKLQKMLKSAERRTSEEPFLAVIIDGLITEARPQTHPKLFSVFEYLHAHPAEAQDVSLRQLARLTGVSKSHCRTALFNWGIGLDKEFAEFRQARDDDLC